jgi:hypothetical protein
VLQVHGLHPWYPWAALVHPRQEDSQLQQLVVIQQSIQLLQPSPHRQMCCILLAVTDSESNMKEYPPAKQNQKNTVT